MQNQQIRTEISKEKNNVIFLKSECIMQYNVDDALDRSRSLEILKRYGVRARARKILREYWDRTTMVARVGRYYGKGFMGGRGVTQGEPLSPTIFNVVVDAVVRHWLMIAVTEAEKRRERGREGRHQAALF